MYFCIKDGTVQLKEHLPLQSFQANGWVGANGKVVVWTNGITSHHEVDIPHVPYLPHPYYWFKVGVTDRFLNNKKESKSKEVNVQGTA